MKTYTAFCQQADGRGTIWIGSVEAINLSDAKRVAREDCSDDWNCDQDDVHVLGIAAGDVEILDWEDQYV